MKREEIEKIVKECFSDKFKCPAAELDINLLFRDHYNVDSYGLIEFVIELEERFDFTFEDEDLGMSKLDTLRSITETVYKSCGE